ncbi:MAG: flagellar biosynthesis protein FliQ [Candidatus Methylomirabilales bacterium]
MSLQQVLDLAQSALTLIVLLSGPVLLAGMVTGLAISLIQAVTSIQEATLTFVPKLLAIFLVLVLCLPWMADRAVRFAAGLFGDLGQFAR